ncbi:hypothetical protein HmCmsJML001_04250 [Escherichia coli]|nr:hypothetical protein HmCmsJML001_04250 [Escherichia coli]
MGQQQHTDHRAGEQNFGQSEDNVQSIVLQHKKTKK